MQPITLGTIDSHEPTEEEVEMSMSNTSMALHAPVEAGVSTSVLAGLRAAVTTFLGRATGHAPHDGLSELSDWHLKDIGVDPATVRHARHHPIDQQAQIWA